MVTARIAPSSVSIVLAAIGISIADAASAYSLHSVLNNPTPAMNDFFGTSIAGVGNSLLLVGAPNDDVGTADAGAAYLFDGNPTSPTFGNLLMTFKAGNPSPSGNFGSSVASVGKNLLIGESFRYASPLQGKSGAAYLFNGDPASPNFGNLLKTFKAPFPSQFDMLGFSVAGMGNNVLVGAFGSNAGASRAGEVYLFDGNPTSSTFGNLLKTFRNPNPAANDNFGVAVTAVGKNVLVGAFRDDVGSVDSGAAYLFDGDPTSLNFGKRIKTLTNPNPSGTDLFGHNDEFGHSVARVGNNCLIGAFREDAGAFDAGAAYLYDCNPLSPTFGNLLKTFVNPTPVNYYSQDMGENFSFSLAGVGNYALIGAWRELAGSAFAGAVYVYDANPISQTFGQLVATFKSPNPTTYGSFGTSVASMGENIFISSIGENASSGNVYLYTPTGFSNSRVLALSAPIAKPVSEPSSVVSIFALVTGMLVFGRKRRKKAGLNSPL